MRKEKIEVVLDATTGINAAQLAAERGDGFRDYLASVLEDAIDERVNMTALKETYPVTLEISREAYDNLLCYSGDYWDVETAARYFLTEAIERKAGKKWKRK